VSNLRGDAAEAEESTRLQIFQLEKIWASLVFLMGLTFRQMRKHFGCLGQLLSCGPVVIMRPIFQLIECKFQLQLIA